MTWDVYAWDVSGICVFGYTNFLCNFWTHLVKIVDLFLLVKKSRYEVQEVLILFWMDFSGLLTDKRRGEKISLPKICYIYFTMIKLGTVIPYLKKIQKVYESYETLLEFYWHQHFSPEISNFCISRNNISLAF